MEVPQVHPHSEMDDGPIRAIFYEGLDHRGASTRHFAYLGLPEGEGPFPAMVLVHGGGGSAFKRWVKLWNERGFAAIAMDHGGQISGEGHQNHQRHEWASPEGCGGFDQLQETWEDQWPHHGVSAVVLAHSLLASLPEVDENRTGITGISWGGYLTSLSTAIDSRFRCAIPVYGCGHYEKSTIWSERFRDMGEKQTRDWLNRWDPIHYLPHVKIPTLWVTGSNDKHFPLDAHRDSRAFVAGTLQQTIHVGLGHDHEKGWSSPEIEAFARHHLLEGPDLAHLHAPTLHDDALCVSFSSEVPVQRGELIFTQDRGPWHERNWQKLGFEVMGKEAAHEVPKGSSAAFINLIDDLGRVSSSHHLDT